MNDNSEKDVERLPLKSRDVLITIKITSYQGVVFNTKWQRWVSKCQSDYLPLFISFGKSNLIIFVSFKLHGLSLSISASLQIIVGLILPLVPTFTLYQIVESRDQCLSFWDNGIQQILVFLHLFFDFIAVKVFRAISNCKIPCRVKGILYRVNTAIEQWSVSESSSFKSCVLIKDKSSSLVSVGLVIH